MDRLPTYAEVRENVISLSQNQGGDQPIQQVEAQPTPTAWGPTEYDEATGCNWQWVDSSVGLPSQGYNPVPDEVQDINALNGPCYNCGGTGHISRNCPSPPKEPRGKAPKGGGNGKTGKAGKAGKGADPRWCPTCNKSGHTPESCWITHPHLKKGKKVQSVDEEGAEMPLQFIELSAVELTCTPCDANEDCTITVSYTHLTLPTKA